jgi:hypothetical protein
MKNIRANTRARFQVDHQQSVGVLRMGRCLVPRKSFRDHRRCAAITGASTMTHDVTEAAPNMIESRLDALLAIIAGAGSRTSARPRSR